MSESQPTRNDVERVAQVAAEQIIILDKALAGERRITASLRAELEQVKQERDAAIKEVGKLSRELGTAEPENKRLREGLEKIVTRCEGLPEKRITDVAKFAQSALRGEPLTEDKKGLRDALTEALTIMQEWSDNHDGEDPFGLCCPCCDGAVPLPHSFGCKARRALRGE